jgi:ribosomal-protein-alanine N-acetyltransferase
MGTLHLETERLKLVAQTREQVRAQVAQLPPHQRAEVSPAWLALLEASSPADPWVHGFVAMHRTGGVVIGGGSFKGPPDADGVVEIAYGVAPEHQGRGYATEVAAALAGYAFTHGHVLVVRAHTRPESHASARVLAKCGFRRVGEVMDPEDGLVWRWEKTREMPSHSIA